MCCNSQHNENNQNTIPVFNQFMRHYEVEGRSDSFKWMVISGQCILQFFIFFVYLLFCFYIYTPDLQESDGGVTHRASNYPDLLLEMLRYYCPVEFLFWFRL